MSPPVLRGRHPTDFLRRVADLGFAPVSYGPWFRCTRGQLKGLVRAVESRRCVLQDDTLRKLRRAREAAEAAATRYDPAREAALLAAALARAPTQHREAGL